MKKLILVNIIVLFFTNMWMGANTNMPSVGSNDLDVSKISIESLVIKIYQYPVILVYVTFDYDGDQPLYYASANQLIRRNNRLYYGFYDWKAWIKKLKDSIMIMGEIQAISYRFIKIEKETEQLLYGWPLESGFIYDDLDDIEEITLIFYIFHENDVKDIEYRDEYIRLLESGIGQRLEISTRTFELNVIKP